MQATELGASLDARRVDGGIHVNLDALRGVIHRDTIASLRRVGVGPLGRSERSPEGSAVGADRRTGVGGLACPAARDESPHRGSDAKEDRAGTAQDVRRGSDSGCASGRLGTAATDAGKGNERHGRDDNRSAPRLRGPLRVTDRRQDHRQPSLVQPGGRQSSGRMMQKPFTGSNAGVSTSAQPDAHQPMQSKKTGVVGSSMQVVW